MQTHCLSLAFGHCLCRCVCHRYKKHCLSLAFASASAFAFPTELDTLPFACVCLCLCLCACCHRLLRANDRASASAAADTTYLELFFTDDRRLNASHLEHGFDGEVNSWGNLKVGSQAVVGSRLLALQGEMTIMAALAGNDSDALLNIEAGRGATGPGGAYPATTTRAGVQEQIDEVLSTSGGYTGVVFAPHDFSTINQNILISVDGGADQLIALTTDMQTAADAAAALATLTGATAAAVDGQVVLTSATTGASSVVTLNGASGPDAITLFGPGGGLAAAGRDGSAESETGFLFELNGGVPIGSGPVLRLLDVDSHEMVMWGPTFAELGPLHAGLGLAYGFYDYDAIGPPNPSVFSCTAGPGCSRFGSPTNGMLDVKANYLDGLIVSGNGQIGLPAPQTDYWGEGTSTGAVNDTVVSASHSQCGSASRAWAGPSQPRRPLITSGRAVAAGAAPDQPLRAALGRRRRHAGLAPAGLLAARRPGHPGALQLQSRWGIPGAAVS